MFYYLALLLMPSLGGLNVLTYHTVRAGGAAFTAFAFSLIFGPAIIHRLRELKIGQYIKKDHVADLHELHKGKAGTPTMGGTMMLFSTAMALLFWGRLNNRLLWLALIVFCLLGAVGFLDDYVKLKKKHNDGLSARAKFAGQILSGLVLGVYLYNNPITVSASYVYPKDVLSWPALTTMLQKPENAAQRHLRAQIDPEVCMDLDAIKLTDNPDRRERRMVLEAVNGMLGQRKLYDASVWPQELLTSEARTLLARGVDDLNEIEVVRLDRLLLEETAPSAIASSLPNLHTKVGVPGFKGLFIPLGPLYIFFIVFIIVAISNAVNLTDGLDGLAAGASAISIMAFAAIAYIVSRADWSQYLFLTYVPEASELFVFGSALLGAGLGFLWFNGHPAEVFMGDTGSLALGGAIGTMAILTKQELLLPVVAGLFVIEAASVVIQVGSYKLTKKRVFRMAPIHHHFELLGWTETKVVLRFWIVALLFALISLATLKLR